AALADRPGAPGDLRGASGGGAQTAWAANVVEQSLARRRLDGDWPARHHRGRDPIRSESRRIRALPFDGKHTMNDTTAPRPPEAAVLDGGIERATAALLDRQEPDGHWVFELEADATIPAEYVLLRHYRGEPIDSALEAQIAVYLRRVQGAHGGWPLFHDGDFDMSGSVKSYFALKMIGDDPQAEHMRRARDAILARGGAASSNVFTCSLLALYGVLPWRSVPVMPVEIMLLPKWFPFHLDKVSYWARTVLVPLLVLMA